MDHAEEEFRIKIPVLKSRRSWQPNIWNGISIHLLIVMLDNWLITEWAAFHMNSVHSQSSWLPIHMRVYVSSIDSWINWRKAWGSILQHNILSAFIFFFSKSWHLMSHRLDLRVRHFRFFISLQHILYANVIPSLKIPCILSKILFWQFFMLCGGESSCGEFFFKKKTEFFALACSF